MRTFDINSKNSVILVGSGSLGTEAEHSEKVYAPKQKLFDNKNNETAIMLTGLEMKVMAKVEPARLTDAKSDLEKIQSTTVMSHSNISAANEAFEGVNMQALDNKQFRLRQPNLLCRK